MTMTIRAGALAAMMLSAALAQSAAPRRASAQQDLATRVRDARDGKVRFTFASRPDVCGQGNSISTRPNSRTNWNGGTSADVEWDNDCEHGPVRMVLNVQSHTVTGIRAYVGGRWRAASEVTDLGTVSAASAASYLLTLGRTLSGSLAEKAIFPASLADSVTIWPALLEIARDERVSSQARRGAVFWLGQYAGDAATKGLVELVGDDTLGRDVRESAVFALSQRPKDEGVPELIRIARTNKDPQIRKRALFWLGQSNDPRALQLFEQLLAGTK
ncbi:MAG TPA: HEAT repeat domain-containing protein [Candidatus Elarobacter sp.]|nr:HEAT repeat domain-containing protein [Candidatus Elarobacter sp.]